MKSKASLFLMEQLVMVLVFALAAALCLQVFLRADQISRKTASLDEAVMIAQNGAELLKAGVAPEMVENQLSSAAFVVQIREEKSPIPGLLQAEIAVTFEQDVVFNLTVGYQEVGQ